MTKLLVRWAKKAPVGAGGAPFRVACVRALRDVVDAESSDQVRSALDLLVRDVAQPGNLRQEAVFALAQFGNRTYVDTMLGRITEATKGQDPGGQAQAWNSLASIRYNLREYAKAVEAYRALIGLIEEGKVPGQGSATFYYNCACSLALDGKIDEAFDWLEKAFERGKKEGQQLGRRLVDTDMDIAALRKDPRFAKVRDRFFGKPASRKSAPKTGAGEKAKKQGDG